MGIPQERAAQPGDYVTAKLFRQNATGQGVLVGKNPSGNPMVQGELALYRGAGEPTVVPDKNIFLPATRAHVARVRAQLAQR